MAVHRDRKKLNTTTKTFVSYDDTHSFVLTISTAVCKYERFSNINV